MNAQLNLILARQRAAGLRHAGARARPAREARMRGRKRPFTRPVTLRGTTVIDGVAGADAFTFTGKIDGRALVPGSYSLLETPANDGILANSSRRHSRSRAEREV
jgi:hypothetical protein